MNKDNKTILLTGGAGYIGSHMAYRLIEEGYEVIIIDDLSKGFQKYIPEDAKLVIADIGDDMAVNNVMCEYRPSSIIHFAAYTVVPDSVEDPMGYYKNNMCNSRVLIDCCIKHKVNNFIFSSSSAVYGNTDGKVVDEMTPAKPVNPYGVSKLVTEWMLNDVAEVTDLGYVALRYFNVAGADVKGRTGQSTKGATHLIKVACQAAIGKRTYFEIFGDDYDTKDGTCVRDFIHVSDLVEAHMLALKYLENGNANRIYNCGYGHGFSVREVIDTVMKISGAKIDVRNSPRRKGDPEIVIASNDLIMNELKWTPKYDNLEFIVETALKWELLNS